MITRQSLESKYTKVSLDAFKEIMISSGSADFDNFYGAQCTDLFRFYAQFVLRIPQPKGVAGAKDFFLNFNDDVTLKSYFERIYNTPKFVPLVGDVAFWNKTPNNPYGHVAIEIGPANTKIHTVLEQNYIKGMIGIREDNYKNYLGVLRPKS